MDRRLFIVIAVVAGHVVGLWALQSGLLRKAVELVVPVSVLAEVIEPPRPALPPTPPITPAPRATTEKPRLTPAAAPRAPLQPLVVASPAPAPDAPAAIAPPPPPAAVVSSTDRITEAPTAPSAKAAPPTTQPSTNVDHRYRPQPPYPDLSKRLGETGTVGLKVMVSKTGKPLNVEINRSSGYFRLDEAALHTVRNRWQFTPGTQNGEPVDMEATFDIRFSLDL